MKKVFLLLILGIVTTLSLMAEGQNESVYPSKTIDIVVPSKAGGSTDALARIFVQVAQKYLPDAEFAVVNKPGSGGQQGFEYIAAAKPDGYTLGLIFTVQLPSHIVSGRARYVLDDFHFLNQILEDPSIIVVPKDSPVNSLEELVSYTKANEMTASVNGIGSDDHLALMLFQSATGVEFSVIPASGSSEQKATVMGGHVDVAFMNISQMISQHQNGEVKILAILGDNKDARAMDIPTIGEVGYDRVKMSGTRGFVIQKDAPADVKNVLEKLMSDVTSDPEFAETLEKSNQSFVYKDGPSYAIFMDNLQKEMESLYAKEPW
ncbi:tripartite tricarboxylate transporter substrate binding protein [Oceanispirochaeta crateris]|nr:tripartite tricarboxylate transporter substrate binding protein [Oceanispirochaeta crateris]